MSHQRFTIAGSTLSLLHPGEQGIITRIASSDETVIDQLKSMGIVPGASVTIAQRSPKYIIQLEQHQFALSQSMAKAIYLRVQPSAVSVNILDQLNQFAIALLKKFTTGQTKYSEPLCSPGDSG